MHDDRKNPASNHGKGREYEHHDNATEFGIVDRAGARVVRWAGEPPTGPPPGNQRQATSQWTLSTDDTEVLVSVSNNKIFLASLKNPAGSGTGCRSLPRFHFPASTASRQARTDCSPDWTYRGATEDKSGGYTVTLRFTSTSPNLELKSVWRAHPGPGPVENWVTIENKSGGNVTYGSDIVAARLRIKADDTVHLHRAEKTAAGKGKVYYDPLGTKARITTDSGIIPLIMLDIGSTHGMYLGYEWELGGFPGHVRFRSSRHHCIGTPADRERDPRRQRDIHDPARVLRDLQGRHRRRQQQVQEVVLEPQDHSEPAQPCGRTVDRGRACRPSAARAAQASQGTRPKVLTMFLPPPA